MRALPLSLVLVGGLLVACNTGRGPVDIPPADDTAEDGDADTDTDADTDADSDADTDVNADDDGDGLTNGDEATYGTDPSNPDSDGDGFNDGDEVADGTNPMYEYSHVYTGGYNVGYCENGEPTATGPSGQGSYGSHRWTAYKVGDVVDNFTLTDQHGEMVDLYSFCGQVVVLSFGAFW